MVNLNDVTSYSRLRTYCTPEIAFAYLCWTFTGRVMVAIMRFLFDMLLDHLNNWQSAATIIDQYGWYL